MMRARMPTLCASITACKSCLVVEKTPGFKFFFWEMRVRNRVQLLTEDKACKTPMPFGGHHLNIALFRVAMLRAVDLEGYLLSRQRTLPAEHQSSCALITVWKRAC